ncbi:pentatricopeptide repeat-containing protein At1g74900, mitochondrial [Spinacia oleracea]|uniref:Pentatricopeptide repeat-containing protein At1g74900, mitochondrial n=1 Tax=Spinacia oleracea TaxID=3562 RepID=A0A9R0JDQ8_SPIOL|nr:pentatricopeptide repeat-containing protein At1g74900, mitochondrial [Spinacia oleracea]XP_021866142.2 pentatricopeptide repeat-containing protein At1g74900, mitochondrial [Spinacia oleracea]XP_056699222.1 pentatricopeptide repeat-containing protein At1g74900, mitochondrial [Spinacia oleracea]
MRPMQLQKLPLLRPFSTTTVKPPPLKSLPATATAVANLVLTTEDPKALSKTLLTSPDFTFSEPLVNQTLKLLWNHGPKALQFFTILDNHLHYAHSLSSFHHAIDISARLRDITTLWILVTRLRSRRLGPTPLTFAIIIERYVLSGKPDKAVEIFLSMHKHGCQQDLNSFNTLLDILCKSKRVEKAHNLFKLLRGKFGADVVSYNVIANGWCLIKRTPKALEVLKEMVERGFNPTLITYNIILKGYFRTGQTKEAWLFFKEMKKRSCEMDVVTYTTLVHGFGVLGEVSKARRLFDEMVGEGVLPNTATYNAMIQVLCKKDSVENAIVLFEEMGRKGYVPNSVTYNLLIRGLCHAGEMDRAMKFVELMKNDGCHPNVQTCNLLIKYYCEVGEIEKGLEVFDLMGSWRCLPNKDTYNILISSTFVRKKPEDLVAAGRLLIEMVDRGFLPTKFTFNRVMNGLLVTGNQAFAREILQLQSKRGLLPRHFRL